MTRPAAAALSVAWLAGAFAAPARGAAPDAGRCHDFEPLRSAFFGDLHVHTALSSDAWMFDVRVTPEDAYRYAFGDAVHLPPNDPEGRGTRRVRIDRSLDFAAVTDHAEFLGEGVLCLDPESPGYESGFCTSFRAGEGRSPRLVFKIMSPWSWRDGDVCGSDGERCRRAAGATWRRIVAAAEAWNDASPECRRTTFPGYEYSSHRLGSNLHRNVIFRSAAVPALPTSYLEASREWELWEALERDCLQEIPGCDVLAIPHNSNISNGRMFAVDYPGAWGREAQRERAALRARMEPVIEIMQHKGDSECRNGLDGVLGGPDELCDFEKFENLAFSRGGGGADPGACYAGPLADAVPHLGPDCLSRLSYARYALVEGLREEERIGVNPFKFGITASTDTHNGMAGGVEERSFPGHLGVGDDTAQKRVTFSSDIPGNASNNPGGLVGVWAEENSRDAIFAALRRKEVFGTSGPRIAPRFFGGWEYAEGLCDETDWLERAYAGGVPMGGDLPAPPAGAGAAARAPVFLTAAQRDPGTAEAPGGRLQRLQVVKGWYDTDGAHHQRVYDVAGSPDNGAGVDLETCAPRGPGHASLCSVWRDPDFDPALRAVYYARVVENPSCRYSTWQCLELSGDRRPPDCDAPKVPALIQERAWTSPIWYAPTSRRSSRGIEQHR